MALTYQKYNIGDYVRIREKLEVYTIIKVEYDVQVRSFKYSLSGYPSWVYENILIKSKGGEVKAKYKIGQEIWIRGDNSESYIIKEIEEQKNGGYRYKLSDHTWHVEDILYIDMEKEPAAIPAIKVGDIVECISSDNETTESGGGAYRNGSYYLVSKVTKDNSVISTALDSNGTVGNRWSSKKFKTIGSSRVVNFDNSIYMCIKDVNDLFTAGKIYQYIDKDGYLVTDKGNQMLITNKHKDHFVVIHTSRKNNDNNAWDDNEDEELPGTSQEDTAGNVDNEWEEVDNVIPEIKEIVPELLDVDI